MARHLHTAVMAVMAVMLAVRVVAVGSAQEAYPQTPPLPQVKGRRRRPRAVTSARRLSDTQAAIDAANSGQASVVAQEAQTALTHAQAAEKDSPSPNLEVAIEECVEEAVEREGGQD